MSEFCVFSCVQMQFASTLRAYKQCLYALSGVRGGAPAGRQWIIRYFEPIGNVSEAVDVYNILGDISSSVPSTSRFEGLDAPPPAPPLSLRLCGVVQEMPAI